MGDLPKESYQICPFSRCATQREGRCTVVELNGLAGQGVMEDL